MGMKWIVPFVALLVTAASSEQASVESVEGKDALIFPSLRLVRSVTTSTVSQDFGDNEPAYIAANMWQERKTSLTNKPTTYLACAEYRRGQETLAYLEELYAVSAVQPLSHTPDHGACFMVRASPAEAALMKKAPASRFLFAVAPILSTLKLAPSLLDHGTSLGAKQYARSSGRLKTTYGSAMEIGNVRGLTLRLSPGSLLVDDPEEAHILMRSWTEDLMSDSLDMYASNFWSDPSVLGSESRHPADHPDGKVRVDEWTRAAELLHTLSQSHGKTAGDICSWDRITVRHTGDNLLMLEGISHLLPKEGTKMVSELKMACFMGLLSQLAAKPEVVRVAPLHRVELQNAAASATVESATTKRTPLRDIGLDGTGEVIQVVDSGLDEASCFFADEDGETVKHGYLFKGLRWTADGSFTTVLSPSFDFDMSRRKVVQYMELFKIPDEGDTGESSSDDSVMNFTDFYNQYYADDDSSFDIDNDTYDDEDDEYDDYSDDRDDYDSYSSTTPNSGTFTEDSYCWRVLNDPEYNFSRLSVDPNHKLDFHGIYKYHQTASSTNLTSSLTSSSPDTDGSYEDPIYIHGTVVAGSAGGSVPSGSRYLRQSCDADEVLACAGGCITASEAEELIENESFDIDTYCPTFECDGYGADSEYCLGDDPLETLVDNGGVARGARLAFFALGYYVETAPDLAGNSLWNSSFGTGAKIHTNSWGIATNCEPTEWDYMYDTFMYENPEHLLLFAAGNNGGLKDIPALETCTIISPALAKNVLSVGATANDPSRIPSTRADGRLSYEDQGITEYTPEGYPWICTAPRLGIPSTSDEFADPDILAFFSSYGPTTDGRIKPEVVAPGDKVFSALSDGTGKHTCKLIGLAGTSMSCPMVAGAAAMVRQYFTDSSFYAFDAKARGLCSGEHAREQDKENQKPRVISCEAFPPSAATVKAMLINSANLMGGSTQPDNYRGFGRVHLEAGIPLKGNGDLALFVADSSYAKIAEYEEVEYTFEVDGRAGLELRATLSWIDPPATSQSGLQLLHDLDLTIVAPNSTVYTMWGSGISDTVNVNERVIVPQISESGRWAVKVKAKALLRETQSYSLVVTGALSRPGCSRN